ncbi:hypothetical protein BOX15_Mlig007730g1 [Macrostomum lignano]|uniref:Tyrosine-protein kinase n=2 Tax=Macrostomum lignano TaxID=282301 RepID=A0A267EMM0_9PLAT|nr:hypothetical protein BOX15_Mlig007730g1 [Macrostomum lignano]
MGTYFLPHPATMSAFHEDELAVYGCLFKFMQARARIESDYANALRAAHAEFAGKPLPTKIMVGTPVYKLWQAVLSNTQALSGQLSSQLTQLNTNLHQLALLCQERKMLKKRYLTEKAQLDAEARRLADEAAKTEHQYMKQLDKVVYDREKFELLASRRRRSSTASGGSSTRSSKMENYRMQYLKSSVKLHNCHNKLVLCIDEANSHSDLAENSQTPALCEYVENTACDCAQRCVAVMEEAGAHLAHSNEAFAGLQSQLMRALRDIRVVSDYQRLGEEAAVAVARLGNNSRQGGQLGRQPQLQRLASRSQQQLQQVGRPMLAFNAQLLREYSGRLKPGQLSYDSFTREHLLEHLQALNDRRSVVEPQLADRRAYLAELSRDSNFASSEQNSARARELIQLRYECSSLECRLSKIDRQIGLISGLVNQYPNGSEVPMGLSLDCGPGSGQGLRHMSSTEILNHPASADRGFGFDRLQRFGSSIGKRLRRHRRSTSMVSLSQSRTRSNSVTQSSRSVFQQSTADIPSSSGVSGGGMNSQSSPEPQAHSSHIADVHATKDIVEQAWYHGLLPRDMANQLLTEDGDFLVRSGDDKYVLVVMHRQQCRHFVISGTEDGMYKIDADKYRNVPAMVYHLLDKGLPVTQASQARLFRPVARLPWQLANQDVSVIERIGKGEFGQVYRGTYQGRAVAVKTCGSDPTRFVAEGRLLLTLQHQNIVQVYGIALLRQPVLLVMEYLSHGSLLAYLRANRSVLESNDLLYMSLDAACGLAYLETKQFIHRDIAARNCLVNDTKVVKIADFGMCRTEGVYQVSGGLKQIPIKWTSPESLNSGTYTLKSDCWSFGILLWEIFSFGESPYSGLTNKETRARVEAGYRLPQPPDCPDWVYRLMASCWDIDPEQRPPMSTVYSTLLSKINRTSTV